MNLRIYSRIVTALLLASFFLSQAIAQPNSRTNQQIQLLLQEKESRTPAQRKMDSRLLQAAREKHGQKMAEGVELEPVKLNARSDGRILVDISGDITPGLLNKIKALGGEIIYSSREYHTVRALISLSIAEAIASLSDVKFIQPAAEAETVGSGFAGKPGSNKAITLPMLLTGGKAPALAKPSLAERTKKIKDQLQKFLLNYGDTIATHLRTQSGTPNSEGDRTHRADDARNTYGYLGQGIRIGVLSDSYNSLGAAAADIANGNLPGIGNPLGNTTPITVLSDYTPATDEGRAMLQIVHDLAPKAQLFYATAFSSPAGFAESIKLLRSAPNNCDIIIDDVSYSDEPVFQDGIIAQAVNTVTAGGALYFSSAGNSGSLAKNTSGVWEGDFNGTGNDTTLAGSTKTGKLHNFGTTANPVYSDTILSKSGTAYYSLHWGDPIGSSANDYDLFVIRANGTVKAFSANIQEKDGTQNPFEIITGFTLATNDRLVVFKTASAAARAISVSVYRGRLKIATTGQTHGHSSAANAFSVAAAPAAGPFSTAGSPTGPYPNAFSSASQVELFTSDGPRRIFYNADSTPVTPGNFLFGSNGGVVRQKPDITAADGVSTTLASSSGLNPFYGTSAAAPHAGAIAALLKSAKPSLTAAQIRTILTTTALDIEAPGPDNLTGVGIIQAFQAMQAVAPVPSSTINLGIVTATEGPYRNNNGIIEPGELGNLVIQLTNPSTVNATNVTAMLTTITAGVTVSQSTASYGTIAGASGGVNTATPFVFGISSSVACGTVINFFLTVNFGGGSISSQSFQFTVTTGPLVASISSTLGSTPPSGTGYTAASGQQTGRIALNGTTVTCSATKSYPGSGASTGLRQYDAYTFTNTAASTRCYTVNLIAANVYSTAYTGSFVPATPATNYLADDGRTTTASTHSYAFNIASGATVVVVVYDFNVAPASMTPYTLEVRSANCATPPTCTAVTITTASIAAGSTGVAYNQPIAASGGSGSYVFSLAGDLPAGLTFSGNTLSGTPTQAGSFTVTVTATDAAGCPAGTKTYTLVISGVAAASVTATAGTPQTVLPGTTFPIALQATVRDAGNNPLSGVNVKFTAPASGASGTFTGGVLTVTVLTNASGIATAPTFTANNSTGSYTVTAAVTGIAAANFSLNNTCPTSFVVTSNADSGPGTLRDVVANACAGGTVTFNPSVTQITLTSGELLINKSITITGPGASSFTISGNNSSRVFNIAAGSVSIFGITLRNGRPISSNGGGAVLITNGAVVNISNCNITNNTASFTGYGEGGGIDNEGGYLTIDRCSIVNNTSNYDGGGITNYTNTATITNSTIAGNSAGATGVGGGIYNYLPVSLTNCTVAGNSANSGGNIYTSPSGDAVTVGNTVIAGGTLIGTGGFGPDINGALISSDYNLIQNTTSGVITGTSTHNITGTSPNLMPLANYGGPTPTLLPVPGSPVIDAGNPALTSGTDQRGFPRLVGTRADMGSVETGTALPVSFVSIKAVQQSAGVQVEWSVASETNTLNYEVEKSIDGRTFMKAATLTARANNNTSVTYTWFDANPVNGVNYYRIKAMENSGITKLSQTVSVKIGGGKGEITVYPNPLTGNSFSLQFSNQPKGTYIVKLFNSLAQQVYSKTIEHQGGSWSQTLNLVPAVSKGIYQLQVSNGDNKTIQKLVIN